MALNKKLATGTVIKAWNYDEVTTTGISIAVKNGNTGDFDALLYVESVKCAEGVVNRLVINKTVANKLGWTIIEE